MPKKPCAEPGCSRLVPVGTPRCPRHEREDAAERYRKTDAARAGRADRAWYNSAAWRGPGGRRQRQLTEEPFCAMCAERGIEKPAEIADHVEPHRGDHAKFWFGLLQSLCRPCHDIRKQRIERRARPPAGGGGVKK